MVREVDPPKPSTKVSTAEDLPNIAATRDIEPAKLKRALRGDVDWITMKALEKDRTVATRRPGSRPTSCGTWHTSQWSPPRRAVSTGYESSSASTAVR